jgi:site-specific DNA recombinase
MKQCFAYVRVSTPKQKEEGVSTEQQQDAIARYAQQHNLTISQWFEEVQTAAKSGRRQFIKMLRLLRQGKADGVIIHKIDRSARNLRDWVDLGELIDAGVTVFFANENLDMHTRGGRLSADIQAVVAADFIRNLREETKKGFYGRLKQGVYPLNAPLGYLDRGKGKAKEIDPVRGPLVRTAFELYATGGYNLDELVSEMYRRGLRNRNGNRVSKNGLSTVLNNSYHCGLIRLKKTGETFQGIHRPLITTTLFRHVQNILRGKTHTKVQLHDHIFRRLLTCGQCGKRLRGELQKGYVYYRCHTKGCPTCVREEVVEAAIQDVLRSFVLRDEERVYFSQRLDRKLGSLAEQWEVRRQAWQVQLGQMRTRLDRLIDAYLAGDLEKDLFESRKATLLMEQREIQEKLSQDKAEPAFYTERVCKVVELANSAWLSYEKQNTEEKRALVQLTTSNRIVTGKNVLFEPSYPFSLLANRQAVTAGDLKRDIGRSDQNVPERHDLEALEHVIEEIYSWLTNNPQTVLTLPHNLSDRQV